MRHIPPHSRTLLPLERDDDEHGDDDADDAGETCGLASSAAPLGDFSRRTLARREK